MSFSRQHFVANNNADCRNPKLNDDSEKRLLETFEALATISKLSENKGKIKCPVCGGDLHYTRAKSNGHIWGKCKTPACLSWMM